MKVILKIRSTGRIGSNHDGDTGVMQMTYHVLTALHRVENRAFVPHETRNETNQELRNPPRTIPDRRARGESVGFGIASRCRLGWRNSELDERIVQPLAVISGRC
jgi:hypothetical protein